MAVASAKLPPSVPRSVTAYVAMAATWCSILVEGSVGESSETQASRPSAMAEQRPPVFMVVSSREGGGTVGASEVVRRFIVLLVPTH
jgi:hypothetical protein